MRWRRCRPGEMLPRPGAGEGAVRGHPRCRRVAGNAVALILTMLALDGAAARNAAPARLSPGTPHEVVFTHYSPLFGTAQILRRVLSPLAREAVRQVLARSHERLGPYPLDLAKERFLVYVPPGPPPAGGFGLLVWVSPSDQAYLPFGWMPQLDRDRVVLVAPERAGNAQAVIGRRVPLVLAAERNIVREYPIDRRHVYIGGFSGGSRVAERVALDYPDVFRGALLDAGSDPLGSADPWGGVVTVPRRKLFLRFQSSSHLIYVSGELDTANLASDASSSQSMRDWCVFGVETHEARHLGHEIIDGVTFRRALDRLLGSPLPSDPARLRACRARTESALEAKLGRVRALISRGRRTAARKLLLEIDGRYGGLASPRSIELARHCACGLAVPGERNRNAG
jgi:pimeloyl-ACP methyl ester carboxylesterase